MPTASPTDALPLHTVASLHPQPQCHPLSIHLANGTFMCFGGGGIFASKKDTSQASLCHKPRCIPEVASIQKEQKKRFRPYTGVESHFLARAQQSCFANSPLSVSRKQLNHSPPLLFTVDPGRCPHTKTSLFLSLHICFLFPSGLFTAEWLPCRGKCFTISFIHEKVTPPSCSYFKCTFF